MEKKKINYRVMAGVLVVLVLMGYYSYLTDMEARNNGVYTIALIKKQKVARNGWKVLSIVKYKNKEYSYDGMIPWEHFNFNDNKNLFFVKILDYAPQDGIFIIPRKIASGSVPDLLIFKNTIVEPNKIKALQNKKSEKPERDISQDLKKRSKNSL